MAVVMLMQWDGIGAEEYESARKLVDWEGDVPPGAMFHAVAVTPQGVRVADVWESAEQFQQFVEQRLMPGVRQLGIPGDPRIEILPAHDVFAPGYQPA